jgi:hypothetical protein
MRVERPVTRKPWICRVKRRVNYNGMHLMRQLSNPGLEVRRLGEIPIDAQMTPLSGIVESLAR